MKTGDFGNCPLYGGECWSPSCLMCEGKPDPESDPVLETICPMIGKPCIGRQCSEFIPRHQYTTPRNTDIGDFFKDLWLRVILGKDVKEHFYIRTMGAQCLRGIRAASKWDNERYASKRMWHL